MEAPESMTQYKESEVKQEEKQHEQSHRMTSVLPQGQPEAVVAGLGISPLQAPIPIEQQVSIPPELLLSPQSLDAEVKSISKSSSQHITESEAKSASASASAPRNSLHRVRSFTDKR